ncbi:RNA 2',3'-cyclic phosphodiesterase [Iodidimonas gelatinilytica]|nr:RNA 2',3'-cyclic phosphodiesterase [Iodidimonas gelatinilytica]
MMIRLFVGLELPNEVKQSLLAMGSGVDGARWQALDQLHLTLRFIGNLDPVAAQEVRLSLQDLSVPAFSVTLQGMGLFGKPRAPRILYVGGSNPAPLIALHEKIDRRLIRAGLAPERRKYIPHVTLARFKGRSLRAAGYVAQHMGFSSQAFDMSHITLFQSHLGHEAAAYEVVDRYGTA